MTRIDETELMDAVARHAGIPRGAYDDETRAMVSFALATIARDLPDVDRRALAEEMPRSLSLEPIAGKWMEPGRAKELVESVIRALGETLATETRVRMQKHLSADLAELLSPREPSDPPPPPSHPPSREGVRPRPTLATGRPGSDRPLSESRPDNAHRHSVARSGDPHGDSKLSGARGTTQERLHETLAEGEPPHPKRTIAK